MYNEATSFSSLAPSYFDHGYSVVPIKLGVKHTGINNWKNIDFEQTSQNYSNYGIAIECGKSGIIALDIDVENEDAKKEIKAILPPIYCGKVGNPNRLPTMFFQKTKDHSDIRTMSGIELIIDARICVLPPTIHPDTKKPYYWVGKNLLEVDVDDLPILETSLLNDIIKIADKYLVKTENSNSEISKSDGTRCNHGSHIKLMEVAMACIHQAYSIDETVKAVIEHDLKINDKISYFLCNSDKVIKVKDKAYNAYQFVLKMYESNLKNKKIDKIPLAKSYEFEIIENNKIEVDDSEDEKIENSVFEKQIYPKWEGIADKIFQHIYESSSQKRSRFSWASTMSVLGTVFGNCVRYQNTLTNTYAMLLTKSTYGKDNPLFAPQNFFSECDRIDLIGNGKPRSDQAIIMSLESQNTRIDTIDEMSDLLKGMGNNKSSTFGIAQTYNTLYTSGNKLFSGAKTKGERDRKNGNAFGVIGKCFSPCISILGATTDSGFSSSITRDLLNDGLGSRFFYFFDMEFKRTNKNIKPFHQIDSDIKEFLTYWDNLRPDKNIDLNALNLSSSPRFEIPEITLTKEAKAFRESFIDKIDDMKLETHNEGGDIDVLYARSITSLDKIAIMQCLSKAAFTAAVKYCKIELSDMEFASNAIDAINKEAKYHLGLTVNDSPYKKKANRVKSILSKKKDISLSELLRKTNWTGKELKEVLDTLVMSDIVKIEKIKTSRRDKTIINLR